MNFVDRAGRRPFLILSSAVGLNSDHPPPITPNTHPFNTHPPRRSPYAFLHWALCSYLICHHTWWSSCYAHICGAFRLVWALSRGWQHLSLHLFVRSATLPVPTLPPSPSTIRRRGLVYSSSRASFYSAWIKPSHIHPATCPTAYPFSARRE